MVSVGFDFSRLETEFGSSTCQPRVAGRHRLCHVSSLWWMGTGFRYWSCWGKGLAGAWASTKLVVMEWWGGSHV